MCCLKAINSREKKLFVSTCLSFCLDCSYFSNDFIKIHEYSNSISFVNSHKVRALCLSITLKSSFVL